ncbi:MAG TPA: Ldh family oxidoreductase [Limnochordales bacterium]
MAGEMVGEMGLQDEALSVPRAGAGELHRFCRQCLERAGMEEEAAAIVASVLVKTSLRGVDTHGVALLPGYVRSLREGRVAARPDMQLLVGGPCTAVLDAGGGLGVLAAYRAMEAAIDMARRSGLALVGVRNSSHFGAAAYYASMAVQHDMIGLAGSNGPPLMAPYGGRKAAMHNMPFAAAIPAGEEPPVVMDFAMSVAAFRKIRQAAQQGRPIPPGWALDREGRPTTDPAAAVQGGVLLPFGHKGYALGILVDVLAGVLSGAGFGDRIPADSGRNTGHFTMAIHVGFFMPVAQFKARMDQLIRQLRATPPAPGEEEVTVPGHRSFRILQERSRDGIPLPGWIRTRLLETAAELQVPAPF